MGIKTNQLNTNLDTSIIKNTTQFYKQILTSWLSLYNQNLENYFLTNTYSTINTSEWIIKSYKSTSI